MTEASNFTGPPEAGDERRTITVIQGDYAISGDPGTTLSTILGSCVAVCLYDAEEGIGGMNHFLLPGENNGATTHRYGVHLMELLINGLLKRGADRSRLKAKIFGGGRMSDNLRDIGQSNVEFARGFLTREAIPIVSDHVGERSARRLRFWPATGAVQQMLVKGQIEVTPPPEPRAPQADITLF
ncbi:chemotaxis protein CheD [Histidinibacterium aquaticum]|uniref:Probable chemoreceptor glutamine deamidase CheD n=1 Tax=Histidinibacterium aquaticum TaxID=2613962 RepID=A0A5J5GIH3_9RHOB|nr:chemotaxis protein CheD [Histidinibacterium aquaticum]KAA9007965.1 chemotaxis protein CheD [Histidinibacterium aquaticum]